MVKSQYRLRGVAKSDHRFDGRFLDVAFFSRLCGEICGFVVVSMKLLKIDSFYNVFFVWEGVAFRTLGDPGAQMLVFPRDKR